MEVENAEYYTPDELAALVKVRRRWIDKWIPKRRLPGMTKVGRYWRFRKSEVEKQLLSGSLLLPAAKRNSRA